MTLAPDLPKPSKPKRRRRGGSRSGPSGAHRTPTEEERAAYVRLARRLVPGHGPLTLDERTKVAEALEVSPDLIRRALAGERAIGASTLERWRRIVSARFARAMAAHYRYRNG